jgi:flagellar hook-associated protein 2
MTTTTTSGVSTGAGVIQSLGIGSGLDVQSLVSQLVAADRAASDAQLLRQGQKITTDVSSLGSLKGALSVFQSNLTPLAAGGQFQALSAASADSTVFTASAGTGAVPGSYNVMVQQLAQPEQLISKPFANGAATVLGSGTLTVSLGSNSFAVDLSTGSNTLADVRDAINKATGNPGVQATLIYGTSGAQLVLTSAQTGASNAITVSASGGDGGLAPLGYSGTGDTHYTEAQQAQDAIIKVSGVENHSASNTVTGAIDGVTLNLVAAKPNTALSLNVSNNTSAVMGSITALVGAYNNLQGTFSSLGSYDSVNKVGGPMLGDWLLNDVQFRVGRGMTDQVAGQSGAYSALSNIGITTAADGTLAIDSAKLQTALGSDPNGVAKLFSGTNGVATRLNNMVTGLLADTGAIAARNTSLVASQKAVVDQQAAVDARMAVVQARYLTQFNALDTLMSQMQSTSSYLTQQLASSSQLANYTTANK